MSEEFAPTELMEAWNRFFAKVPEREFFLFFALEYQKLKAAVQLAEDDKKRFLREYLTEVLSTFDSPATKKDVERLIEKAKELAIRYGPPELRKDPELAEEEGIIYLISALLATYMALIHVSVIADPLKHLKKRLKELG